MIVQVWEFSCKKTLKEKVEQVKEQKLFKSKFAKGESGACKRKINIKRTSWNYRPNLQLEDPKIFGLLLDPKIHSLKWCIKELQESHGLAKSYQSLL
jgi:hypothetical protein